MADRVGDSSSPARCGRTCGSHWWSLIAAATCAAVTRKGEESQRHDGTRSGIADDEHVGLNLETNAGKCEHQCRVEDLNPSGQVPPQGTFPVRLFQCFYSYFEYNCSFAPTFFLKK